MMTQIPEFEIRRYIEEISLALRVNPIRHSYSYIFTEEEKQTIARAAAIVRLAKNFNGEEKSTILQANRIIIKASRKQPFP